MNAITRSPSTQRRGRRAVQRQRRRRRRPPQHFAGREIERRQHAADPEREDPTAGNGGRGLGPGAVLLSGRDSSGTARRRPPARAARQWRDRRRQSPRAGPGACARRCACRRSRVTSARHRRRRPTCASTPAARWPARRSWPRHPASAHATAARTAAAPRPRCRPRRALTTTSANKLHVMADSDRSSASAFPSSSRLSFSTPATPALRRDPLRLQPIIPTWLRAIRS